MAETDIHATCMMYVTAALRRWFEKHGRADVYVGSNNFLYYERGNPRAAVSPDVYVVVGAPAHLRDTYLLWNEPKGPDFVLEVTSASTRRNDERRKRDVYARSGRKIERVHKEDTSARKCRPHRSPPAIGGPGLQHQAQDMVDSCPQVLP